MKKRHLIFTVMVALAALSCSKDQVTELQEESPIEFRMVMDHQSKAVSYTASTLTSFNVTAWKSSVNRSTGNPHINQVEYNRGNDGVYTSTKKYYWPSSGNMDFYAYAPTASSSNGVTRISELEYTVTPLTDTDSQVDFVFAHNSGNKAGLGTSGVRLNFRHAMSQIRIKIKNTNGAVRFNVTGWKIVGVDGSASFEFDDADDTNDIAQNSTNTIDRNMWYDNDDSYDASYSKTFLAKSVTDETSSWGELNGSAILIPQTAPMATGYTSGGILDGAYIAIQYEALNTTTQTNVIPGVTWGCWPVAFDWEPGFCYNYVIDLAQFGYKEDGTGPLDPVMEGSEIEFVNVTVDSWQPENDADANKIISITGDTVETVTIDPFLRFHTEGGTNRLSIHQDYTAIGKTEPSLEYSCDEGATWTTWVYDAPIEFGDDGVDQWDLLVRGKGFYNKFPSGYTYEFSYFVFEDDNQLVDCSGKIGGLYDYEDPDAAHVYQGQYSNLFRECKCLRSAPLLNSKVILGSAYAYMFDGCINLVSVQDTLPVLDLHEADRAYCGMFADCTSLTKVPVLPSTMLSWYCYAEMFYGCTSLTTAPELPATELEGACYSSMFYGCTNLTTAPELPATELKNYCYSSMFGSCSSLNYVKAMFTEVQYVSEPIGIYIGNWLEGTAANGTLEVSSGNTWTESELQVPAGWTLLKQ